MMNSLQLQICDIQGRLFKLSADEGYASVKFVKTFMTSEVAKALDSKYNRMQWAGEEYLLEELADIERNRLTKWVLMRSIKWMLLLLKRINLVKAKCNL